MVRFSDMLGGGDDSKAPPASTVPLDEIADEIPEPDDEPETPDDEPVSEVPVAVEQDAAPDPPANASPQEVLDRLTQYAAEHVPSPEPPSSAPPPPPPPARLEPVGDDLLPRSKRGRRS